MKKSNGIIVLIAAILLIVGLGFMVIFGVGSTIQYGFFALSPLSKYLLSNHFLYFPSSTCL